MHLVMATAPPSSADDLTQAQKDALLGGDPTSVMSDMKCDKGEIRDDCKDKKFKVDDINNPNKNFKALFRDIKTFLSISIEIYLQSTAGEMTMNSITYGIRPMRLD